MNAKLRFAGLVVLILSIAGLINVTSDAGWRSGGTVRPPIMAGKFYPAETLKLTSAIDSYLEEASLVVSEKPIALIAPHAGYIFSGQIAADAYRQAMDHEYDLVVVLGTNHTVPGFKGVSIYPGGGYRTPLGISHIDVRVTKALSSSDKSYTFEPDVHKMEHSVEVQMPFIQHLFPKTKILVAVIGQLDPALCTRFGKALAEVIKDRQALIIASTDLSHYPKHKDACKTDRLTLEAMARMDEKGLYEHAGNKAHRSVSGLSTCACGLAPAIAAISAAKELGANRATVVSYANSGDTAAGDANRVVGYGAVAFTQGDEGAETGSLEIAETRMNRPSMTAESLTEENKKALLSFARESIKRFLKTETTPLARDFSLPMFDKCAAFVTLKKNGELRGCIGHMAEDSAVCKVVGAMAWRAAFQDARFPPLEIRELDEIEIEISLLTPAKPVDGPEAIVVGRDGVVLSKLGKRAVFLPQVATENDWDRETMLDQLCVKAGLPVGGWKENTRLFTFQAVVFGESHP